MHSAAARKRFERAQEWRPRDQVAEWSDEMMGAWTRAGWAWTRQGLQEVDPKALLGSGGEGEEGSRSGWVEQV